MTQRSQHFSQFGFEAARRTPRQGLHGHSFRCATVSAQKLPEDDIKKLQKTLNYSDLKEIFNVESDIGVALNIAEQLPSVEELCLYAGERSGVLLSMGDSYQWRRYRFEAAHFLPNVPEGHKCGRLHGHGFEVTLLAPLRWSAESLDEHWQPLYERLHGHCLNRIVGLENPTSEVLAEWIWRQLIDSITDLLSVDVRETVTAGCRYDGQTHRIWKQQEAECAVQLAGFDEPMGHSYRVRLHLEAPLDKVMGWTQDYGDVKTQFQPLYRQLDHHCLNEILPSGEPSDLAVAEWLRQGLGEALPALNRIDVHSTPEEGAILEWGAALATAPRLVI
ncbi:probable 6-pyruvoyltetrahydrobiopterin synthase [gamma proteobacterium HTCC5015]|nr:probable 6-pyruvoyltetrahydrobiopterin synthase [gamma proteobacterium HTCC5015]